jgi:hypothetical protein
MFRNLFDHGQTSRTCKIVYNLFSLNLVNKLYISVDSHLFHWGSGSNFGSQYGSRYEFRSRVVNQCWSEFVIQIQIKILIQETRKNKWMRICNCIQFRLQIHNTVDYVPYFDHIFYDTHIKLLKPQLSTCQLKILLIHTWHSLGVWFWS